MVPWGDTSPKLAGVFQRKKPPKGKNIRSFILLSLLLLNLFVFGGQLKDSFFHKESRAANLNQVDKISNGLVPTPNHIGKIPISFQAVKQNKYIQINSNNEIIYSVDVALQRYAEKVLRDYRVPYGVVVAVEPNTGRILALAGYSRYYKSQAKNMGLCFRASFPAASIIKLVTASAALELDSLTPESQISYEGNMYHITPQKLRKKINRRQNTTSFAMALAKSNNVVFAKVAVNVVGSRNLTDYAQRFGFNRTLANHLPVEISKARIPGEFYGLGESGAGFGEIYMSPIHGTMIAATIANKGEMVQPHLIQEVRDRKGNILYQAQKKSLGRAIQPDTARELDRMMQGTITLGTARKAFKDRRGRPFFPNMAIAGKTGSLNGNNPRGAYHWFVGFAPADNPRIAIAALVINSIDGGGWRIKGSQLARMVLQKYFSK